MATVSASREPEVEICVYEQKTDFTVLRVIDKGDWRYLVFDDLSGDPRLMKTEAVYQTRMRKSNPHSSWDTYTLSFQLPLVFEPEIRSVFLAGLGGGTIARQYLSLNPELQVTAAEIDAEVVRVAREYFGVAESPRLRIITGDARKALLYAADPFDLICLDVFGARSIPTALFTREFAEIVASKLGPQGLLAANVNGTLAGPQSLLQERITRTFSGSLSWLRLFPTMPQYPERYQMMLLLGGTGNRTPTPEEAERSASLYASAKGLPNRLVSIAASCVTPETSAKAKVITDDEAARTPEICIYADPP